MKVKLLNRVKNIVANGEIAHDVVYKSICIRGVTKHAWESGGKSYLYDSSEAFNCILYKLYVYESKDIDLVDDPK